METSKEEQRWAFVIDAHSQQGSMTELREHYPISHPTGYKWLRRSQEAGEWCEDRSRVPRRCPHRTPAAVERQIVKLREEYAILDRHGLLRKRRRKRRWDHPGTVALETERPNQVWPADFKGHFRTGDGKPCYPLTVTDHYSRRLLACRAGGGRHLDVRSRGFVNGSELRVELLADRL